MGEEEDLARKSPIEEEEDFSGKIAFCEEEVVTSWDVTIVFWNLEDYPIPEGADIGCIHGNIVSALYGMGFDGRKSIQAYGDPGSHDIDALRKAGIIYYFPESERVTIRLLSQCLWI